MLTFLTQSTIKYRDERAVNCLNNNKAVAIDEIKEEMFKADGQSMILLRIEDASEKRQRQLENQAGFRSDRSCGKLGLTVYSKKNKARSVSRDQQDINIILQNQKTLNNVERFVYLGSKVTYLMEILFRRLTIELEKQPIKK